jgi:cell volume regulation protein A
MEYINYFLLTGALLMFAGIVLGASSSRFGVPFLLVFLLIGMLAGADGPGGIQFDDYSLSFLIGNLALAIILLDGGLRTRISTFRVALKPSLTLATVGVVATAASVGAFAKWIFDIDWAFALLLGTIVGSTDAAAVFSLLRSSGTRLNDRIANTLEIESGINDPMVIFLVIALIEMLSENKLLSIPTLALQLLQQFGIGSVSGVLFGYLLSEIFKRMRVGEGLQALLLCSGGVLVFALTNIIGGSGFLAVYLVGLVVGNYRHRVSENVLRAMDGMAWLGQSGMFLLLGLLVTPHNIQPVAFPAVAVALFLMLVARPVAVFLCLLPFRFSLREILFISWVGLRGAVPIVMAVFPLLAGIGNAGLIFNVAFMVVLLSLTLQGTSIPSLARLMGLNLPGKAEPLTQVPLEGLVDTQPFMLVQFRVAENASIIGVKPKTLALPPECKFVNIARQNRLLDPSDVEAIHEGDVVSLIAAVKALDQLSEIFFRQETKGKASHEFYGDFILDGDVIVRDIAGLYGNAQPNHLLQDLTLDEAIRTKLRRHAVQGDSTKLCGLEFTVREVDAGRVIKVGMRLPRPDIH